jgi:hypothetical protein
MINRKQAEAVMDNIIGIPSLEACDELRAWLWGEISAIREQLAAVDAGDDGEWRRRASISLYAHEGKLKAVNRRREALLAVVRQKTKERNIEKAKIERQGSERMFIDICKQIMSEEEYLRIWALAHKAMKDKA